MKIVSLSVIDCQQNGSMQISNCVVSGIMQNGGLIVIEIFFPPCVDGGRGLIYSGNYPPRDQNKLFYMIARTQKHSTGKEGITAGHTSNFPQGPKWCRGFCGSILEFIWRLCWGFPLLASLPHSAPFRNTCCSRSFHHLNTPLTQRLDSQIKRNLHKEEPGPFTYTPEWKTLWS